MQELSDDITSTNNCDNTLCFSDKISKVKLRTKKVCDLCYTVSVGQIVNSDSFWLTSLIPRWYTVFCYHLQSPVIEVGVFLLQKLRQIGLMWTDLAKILVDLCMAYGQVKSVPNFC